jgi:hypothetical protein
LTPLVIKRIERINAKESRPPRGLFAISRKISSKVSDVVGGRRESMKMRNSIWKSSIIVIYGIRLSMKSRNGKIAIKKLNAIALALVEKVPSIIPPEYITQRSKRLKPSIPGRITLRVFLSSEAEILSSKVFAFFFTRIYYMAFKLISIL